VPEAVYIFWGILVLLAMAAGCNHGWHHVRDSHVTERLHRVSSRDRGNGVLVGDRPAADRENDWLPGV
jgi:hypothetical protein